MKIFSTAFENGGAIPKKYTGEGEDVSPPLTITDVPEKAKSLALIVDDPDAPMGTFDHWLVWNIPLSHLELPDGAHVPNQGKNDFGEVKYCGPMPPPGSPHRYFFKIYALDCSLSLPDGSSKAQLLDEIATHTIDKAEYMGTYRR